MSFSLLSKRRPLFTSSASNTPKKQKTNDGAIPKETEAAGFSPCYPFSSEFPCSPPPIFSFKSCSPSYSSEFPPISSVSCSPSYSFESLCPPPPISSVSCSPPPISSVSYSPSYSFESPCPFSISNSPSLSSSSSSLTNFDFFSHSFTSQISTILKDLPDPERYKSLVAQNQESPSFRSLLYQDDPVLYDLNPKSIPTVVGIASHVRTGNKPYCEDFSAISINPIKPMRIGKSQKFVVSSSVPFRYTVTLSDNNSAFTLYRKDNPVHSNALRAESIFCDTKGDRGEFYLDLAMKYSQIDKVQRKRPVSLTICVYFDQQESVSAHLTLLPASKHCASNVDKKLLSTMKRILYSSNSAPFEEREGVTIDQLFTSSPQLN